MYMKTWRPEIVCTGPYLLELIENLAEVLFLNQVYSHSLVILFMRYAAYNVNTCVASVLFF